MGYILRNSQDWRTLFAVAFAYFSQYMCWRQVLHKQTISTTSSDVIPTPNATNLPDAYVSDNSVPLLPSVVSCLLLGGTPTSNSSAIHIAVFHILNNWWFWYACVWFSAFRFIAIIHNQMHCGVFYSSKLNRMYELILSPWYGWPVHVWIPTHNLNHHVFGNREGDMAATTEIDNNLISLFKYPGRLHEGGTAVYAKYYREKGRLSIQSITAITQFIWVYTYAFTGLYLDWKLAMTSLIIPAFCVLECTAMINYLQHVHTQPYSRWQHSRNFTGTLFNIYMFNNGYHLAHHEKPNAHWSELPAIHDKIAEHPLPELNVGNFTTFMLSTYFLSIWDAKKFGTRDLRNVVPKDPNEMHHY